MASAHGEITDTCIRKLPSNKQFHLFVSYSSEDVKEVISICRDLEKKHGLKCLNYERDFQAGKLIDQNVLEGMESSEKILIVLSRSYIKKLHCLSEAKRACDEAFKQKHIAFVIPVLLHPVTDIPDFLKLYRYIEYQKEKDVAASIAEAFYNEDTFSSAGEGRIDDGPVNNGECIWTMSAKYTSSFWKSGGAYVFPELTDTNTRIFRKKSLECENQLREILAYTNSSSLMKKFGILGGNMHCCTCFMMSAFVYFLIFTLTFLIFSMSEDLSDTVLDWSLIFILTGSLLPAAAVGYLTYKVIKKRTLKLRNQIRQRVWKINKESFDRSKCLVEFHLGYFVPNIRVFRCDTEKCQMYLCEKAMKENSKRDEYSALEVADQSIERMLRIIQLTSSLKRYLRLNGVECDRHIPKRKCICQLIEERKL